MLVMTDYGYSLWASAWLAGLAAVAAAIFDRLIGRGPSHTPHGYKLQGARP